MKLESVLLKANTTFASSNEVNLHTKQREIGRGIANTNNIRRYREQKETKKNLTTYKHFLNIFYRKQNTSFSDHDWTQVTKVKHYSVDRKLIPSLNLGEITQKRLVKSFLEGTKKWPPETGFKIFLEWWYSLNYKMKTKLDAVIN